MCGHSTRTHRLIAAEMLGRPLKPAEVVHHIDLDHSNNDRANLMVFTSNQHHSRYHYGAILVKRKDGAYQTRSKRPSPSRLRELIAAESWVALGRRFGVSDNAVRKWAQAYGIETKMPRQARQQTRTKERPCFKTLFAKYGWGSN